MKTLLQTCFSFLAHLILLPVMMLFFQFQATAANLYWTDKSNDHNWDNPQNWSFDISGTAAGQVPTPHDAVYFNQPGIPEVHLNGSVEIQSLSVAKDVALHLQQHGTSEIRLSGDLILEGSLEGDSPASFVFRSTEIHNVFSSFAIAQNIRLENGTLRCQTDLICEELDLVKGKLETQNHALYASRISASSNIKFSGHSGLVIYRDFIDPDFEKQLSAAGMQVMQQNKQLLNPCGSIPFTLTAVVTTNYNGWNTSCNGVDDATICVNVIGGVGPFTYQWIGAGGPATQCWTGVGAGNYLVVVFDQGQGGTPCNTSIVVNEPTALTLFSWTGTNPSCNGVCDGTATPIIIGGQSPYNYTWSTGESTPTATQLCVGQNNLTVTDANGCSFDTTFFILTPTPVAPNASGNNVSCFGFCDGAAFSSPSGGNGAPYTFSWNPGGSTNDTISGLCVGSYTVTVTDNNGCTGQQTVNITQPVAINIALTNQTNLICNGICSGSLTVNASNGTTPYSYQWFNATTGLPLPGQTSPTASGLCTGNYYVVVTDANGCFIQSNTFTITQPTAITGVASSTNCICNGVCTGTLTVNPAGGTPGYTITWINAATSNPIGNGSPLNNVCPGNYFAQIQDANGCIINTNVVVVTEPPALTLSVSNTNLTCNAVCSGTASAVTGGGTPGLTVTWHQSPSGTQIGAAGNNISNLCAGDYFATVTDANGCQLNSAVFTVSEPPALVISNETNTDISCNGLCDGSVNLTVSGGTPAISIQWFDSPGNNPVGNGAPLNGLCTGNYYAVVTDANGCTATSSIQQITEPPALSVTVDTVGTACGTNCNGVATANPLGGSPGYTYNWFDATTGLPIGQTGSSATGLCAGSYYVVVSDANGCSIQSATVVILTNTIVSGNIVATNINCNSFCNGLADLTPSGGASPYTYVWYDQNTGLPIGQSTQNANGLCAGDYYVIVTDANLCSSVPIQVSITQPNAITVNLSSTNILCAGQCTGSITAVVGGGTGPYTLSWVNSVTGFPIGQSGLTATNLCAGSYELQVTDANGCLFTSNPVVITEPTPLAGSLATTSIACNGQCNGLATYNVGGGVNPYVFSWSSSGNTTSVETNLCAGNYTVSVTDANGCSMGPTSFTITEPSPFNASVVNGSVSCLGLCNGVVSVNPMGGTGPYTYQWNDPAFQTTPVASGLCAGSYDVTITDANGCTYGPFTATVANSTSPTVSVTSTNALCNGQCNGTATATPAGGAAPYSYQWNDPLNQTTQTASGLCAGNYTVSVTDANGCSSGPAAVTITQPTSITVTPTVTNAACNGTCNGSISTVVAGGTGPYTYFWSNGATTSAVSGLCSGTYTVVVTDANGCQQNQSGTVNQPNPLTASMNVTSTACNVCNASATVIPAGGTPGYTYQWGASAGNQTTQTANGLCAGAHPVTVTDNAGCTAVFTAAISNPTGETVGTDSTNATCSSACNGTASAIFICNDAPCTVQWDDPAAQTTSTATGLCPGVYTAVVTNNSGCVTSVQVTVGSPNPVSVNAVSTNILCNGTCTGTGTATPSGGTPPYTYNWNDPASQTTSTAFNLCVGGFQVIVTDSAGCMDTATVFVTEPTAISFSTSSTNINCPGQCNGVANAFPAGGTPPYTYQWDDPGSQTSQSATGLCGGTYNVTVFDNAGCTSGPQSVTVNVPGAPSISVVATNPQCSGVCNGTATATVSGGTPPYFYSWNDPFNQTTATATNLCAGTYTVTVTDVAGCLLGVQTVTLNGPSAIAVALTPQNPLCNGLCNGLITATVNGGSAPYNLAWNVSGQTGFTATNLCPGNYTLTVTDANGCMQTANSTLVNPAALQANLNVNNASCSGQCDGSASVNPTGGSAPLSVVWSPSNQTGNSISSLCTGNYSVSISDANGCSQNFPFAISEPAQLVMVTGSSPASCGVCNGTASVGPAGGTPPYSYQWGPTANNQTTLSAQNLCAGIYGVTVTDALGCQSSTTVNVTNLNAETLSLTITDATCADLCNGSATAISSCNNGPCSFQWFDILNTNLGVTTSSISNLCPGTYYVQLTNGLGCINITQFTIGSPDTLVVTGTVAPPPCNGICNTSISLNVAGGTPGYSYQWGATAGNSTNPIVNNLCAGSYSVIVTDAIGCDDTVSFTFIDPPALQLNISQTGVTCNGDCNGTATAIVSGGTPGYTYTWNDPGSQTSAIATGLCGGTYALVVTDAAGCSAVNGNVTIPQPALLTLLANSTGNVCSGDCNGTATAAVNGGSPPYNVQWNDPAFQTALTATGLCAGNYNVTVTDNNNCSAGPVSVNVPEPTPVTFTVSVTDITCSGTCSGAITVNAAGGTGGYLYSFDNGNTFQASNTLSNLCAGAYPVLVTDGSGCFTAPQNVNVNQPTPLTATFTTFEPPCGVNSGAITIFPLGGTPGYTFAWFDMFLNPLGQTTQTAINLPAGIYSVTVTDANGCSTNIPVNLSNSNAPTASSTSTSPLCNGSCTGTIDVTVSGGTPGYTYWWIPGGQTTEDLTNVCAGTYLLQISDANACLRFEQVTVSEPAALTASFSSFNATCGQCNGSATVTGSGGTAPLSFIWSNGQTGLNATNLCAGAYTVQINDSNGCSQQFNMTIDNTSAPALAVSVTNVTCGNICNGSAIANAFGGTAPYSFFWLHNGSANATQNNLCAGNYIVQVQDAMGCVNTQSFAINAPQQLADSVIMIPATCGVCDGTLAAYVTSGFPPYTFQWSASAGGGNTFLAQNLCQGTHFVVITDGLGCSDTVFSVMNNTTVPDVTLSITDVDCYGNCNGTATANISGNAPFVTTWQNGAGIPIGQSGTNATNLCSGNYTVQVSDAANCVINLPLSIDEPDSIQLSLPFIQDETCFNTCDGILSAMPVNGTLPITYQWNDPLAQTLPTATGLCDGVYTVIMTDANGCQAQLTDTVSDPPAINIQLDSIDATCSSVADGAIDATVTGGAGGFSYSWTGPNGFTANTEDLSNLFTGLYVLTVTDANGCSTSDSVMVNALLVAQANAGPDTSYCASGGNIIINGTGSPGVTFQWFDALGNVLSNTAVLNTAPSVGNNTFILVVTINGCTGSDTVTINYLPLPPADAGANLNVIHGQTIQIGGTPTTSSGNTVAWTPSTYLNDTSLFNPNATPDTTTIYVVNVTDANGCMNSDTMLLTVLPDIIFPNGFSPNGDGQNDVWIIDFISEFPDNEVQVFNRWGQPVFYSQGYQTPWDGTYQGKPVTVGTYYYIIKLNHPLYPNDFTGPLTILR